MTDGHRFTETTDHLTPGWLLHLPADANPHRRRPTTRQRGDRRTRRPLLGHRRDDPHDAWGRTHQSRDIRLLATARRRQPEPARTPARPRPHLPGPGLRTPTHPPDPQAKPTVADRPAAASTRGHRRSGRQLLEHRRDHPRRRMEQNADYRRSHPVLGPRRHQPRSARTPTRPRPDLPGAGFFELPAIPDDPVPAAEPDIGQANRAPLRPHRPPHTGQPTPPDATAARTHQRLPQQRPRRPRQPGTTPPEPRPRPSEHSTDRIDDRRRHADAGAAGELFPIAARLAGLGILGSRCSRPSAPPPSRTATTPPTGTLPTPPPPETAGRRRRYERALPQPPPSSSTSRSEPWPERSSTPTARLHKSSVSISPPTPCASCFGPRTPSPPPGWDRRRRPQLDDPDQHRHRPTPRSSRGPRPISALVTVGHGDHSQLLLDLEFLGATQITGEPDDVLATCHTMATELAVNAFADDLQIICVGFGTDSTRWRASAVDDLTESFPSSMRRPQPSPETPPHPRCTVALRNGRHLEPNHRLRPLCRASRRGE